MALTGEQARFLYSGAVSSFVAQSNPLLSLGGWTPSVNTFALIAESAPYAQATLDGVSPAINKLSASTPDTGETDVPAIGDWIMVVTGNAAPAVGKVVAIDTGVVTLDRELPALTAASDTIRTSKAENLFPDVTLAQASAGVVDHLMIYFFQRGGSTEGDFQFWIEPLTPSAATIEIMAAGGAITACNAPDITLTTDDPFSAFGNVDFADSGGPFSNVWGGTELINLRYSEGLATPGGATGVRPANANSPIWLRRTIPTGSTGGKTAFALFGKSIADPSPNPDPFVFGFIFAFDIPELTYTGTLAIDRTVYIRGATRVTGTVVDQFGVPVPNLNAWVEIDSGPGSVASDQTGRTDTNGQISATYTAPLTLSTDAVLKIVIPTNSEL